MLPKRRSTVAMSLLSSALSLYGCTGLAQDATYGNMFYYTVTPNVLYLSGEIQSADDFELRRALRNHPIEVLALDSGGGGVFGGLSAAGIIGDRKLSVYIPPDARCLSACSYLFFAGAERKIAGLLGVHQFASTDGNATVSVGEAERLTQSVTAEILGFLREFETPAFVAERMFESPDMYVFNDSEISRLETDTFSLTSAALQKIDVISKEIRQLNRQPKAEISKQEMIALVQQRLNDVGCNAGAIDGIVGRQTTQAIKQFVDAVGLNYHPDILLDATFLEKLAEAGPNTCTERLAPAPANTRVTPPLSKPSVAPLPIPLQIASHWKASCKNRNGATISTFFLRVNSYNNRTGKVIFIMRSLNGDEASIQATIKRGTITVYNHSGRFNSDYTAFNVRNEDCPGGIKAVALL